MSGPRFPGPALGEFLSTILGTPIVNQTGLPETALFEEQLGLKLVQARAPHEFVVIDQAERPAPN